MACAFYQKLSDRYRNFYYAELARQRMKRLPATPAGETAQYPLLDRVPHSALHEARVVELRARDGGVVGVREPR